MKLVRLACTILVILSASLIAQTPPKPAFEVASIKPAPDLASLILEIRSGKRGLGTLQTNIDGARVDMGYTPLNNMIVYAYRLKPHQIVGPDWLASQAFEIHAKIPEGASKDQIPEMMQTLLAERFKLTTHRENKEQSVYAIIVSKDGHKLKEAIAESTTPADDTEKTPKSDAAKGEMLLSNTPEGQVKIKQEGRGMVLSGGRAGQTRINMGPNGALSLEISKVTMADFADILTQLLDRPVVNMTELKGSYQVALEIPQEEIMVLAQRIAPKMGIPLPMGIGGAGALAGAASGAGGPAASDPSGGAIFRAIQQLGLKLDSRKAPVETLVIDHIEKDPTEN
jgi:uncharacterized protein (TIGR03435 family)